MQKQIFDIIYLNYALNQMNQTIHNIQYKKPNQKNNKIENIKINTIISLLVF